MTLKIGDTELVYDDPVRAALDELERASDERMNEREPVEAPSGGAPEPLRESQRAEQSARPATRRPSAPAPAPRSGINGVNVMVGLLALSVLALSLLGLWLLFRA